MNYRLQVKGNRDMGRIFSSVLIFCLVLFIMTGCIMGNINLLSEDEGQNQEEIQNKIENNEGRTSEFITELSVPKKGGSLSIPLPQLDTLNPLLTQSKELISFFGLIYEGIFSFDQDLKPVPALVEKWEVAEDAKRWSFYLKKGLKWHNGEELTAEDVKFTFEILRDFPEATNSYYGQNLLKSASIESFEIEENDPYAFIITLNEPVSNLCALLTFPILPKSVYQSINFVAENYRVIDLALLVGTGPYKVDIQRSDVEKQIWLVRNTGWWGNEPYIDSIIAKIYENNEEERLAFQKGEVDLVDTHVLFAEHYAVGEGIQLYRYLTQNYDFIGINFKGNSPLLDRRVRQAIAYGLDRKDIIFRVYFNNALAVDVPVPSDSWLYNPNSRIYDYQPDKAIELLTDAGWTNLDEDIYLEKMNENETLELSFTLITDEDDSVRKDVAKIIQEQMKLIGIRVDLQFLPGDKIKQILLEGNLADAGFDAILAGYGLDLAGNLYFAFHSSQIGNGFNNFIGYSNQELDELLDRARITTDERELANIYKDIQTHLIKELPFISLYFRTNSLLVKGKVKGIKTPRDMQIYNNIEEWYLEE